MHFFYPSACELFSLPALPALLAFTLNVRLERGTPVVGFDNVPTTAFAERDDCQLQATAQRTGSSFQLIEAVLRTAKRQ